MTEPPNLRILRTGADEAGAYDAARLVPLLHVHIPKCAGTTLDRVMMGVVEACGRKGFHFPGTIYGQGFSGLGKREAWEVARGFRYPADWLYASGHIPFGRFPQPGAKADLVSIIRDPVSRLISMFWMGVRRHAWTAETPVEDLFKAGLFASDSMVRQLCGEVSRERALDASDVETALVNFRNVTYAGRIEDFEALLASILAAYGVPYLAYHSFQVGVPGPARDRDRLAAEFAPFMELDQAFFDLAAAGCPRRAAPEVVSIEDIAASSPILLASPHLNMGNAVSKRSAFVTTEALSHIMSL